MRVLVTGASGFVGGAIATTLAGSGAEVIGLSRREAAPPGVRALGADIAAANTLASVAELVGSCHAVVHAAASLDKSGDAESLGLVNCLGTQHVLHLARMLGARRFVFISGITVIGRPAILPIDEEHPTHPLTAYHATKLLGEHLTAIAAGAGLGTMSLRVAAPVGPGTPRGRILSEFVAAALAGAPLPLAGTGARRQDYIDVRDVGAAVALALHSDRLGLVNTASGRAVSNAELATRCIKVLGSTSSVELTGRPDPDDAVEWRVSTARARAWLGFEAQHSLDESIEAVAGEIR